MDIGIRYCRCYNTVNGIYIQSTLTEGDVCMVSLPLIPSGPNENNHAADDSASDDDGAYCRDPPGSDPSADAVSKSHVDNDN